MAVVPLTYICDVCNKRRDTDVNHWITMSAEHGTLTVERLSFADGIHTHHACGFDHATILFARWMSTRSLDEVKGEAKNG